MDGQQACRIKAERPGNIYNREEWPEMIEFMTDCMIRLIPALKQRLQAAPEGAWSHMDTSIAPQERG